MPLMDIGDWMDEQTRVGVFWYLKRLSANDTQATGGHQAGPYIPKQVIFDAIPSLYRPLAANPDRDFELAIDSHADMRTVRAIWYNQRTRNETRVTGFGGSSSPLLDPYSTGALTIFAFRRETDTDPPACHVWVCDNLLEEDVVESVVGPVEPGEWRTWPDLLSELAKPTECWLAPEDIPPEWLDRFPTTAEMARKTIDLRPEPTTDVDLRLARRHNCEYQLFRSIEHAIEFPRVARGYNSMNEFLAHAQSVMQRRKARAGRSLELHVRHILIEEDFVEGRDFSFQAFSEGRHRPDFLFPNAAAYKDPAVPADRLRMLGVKRTLRERWRQVLEEADRIGTKHLLTLDSHVSAPQLAQMHEAGVQLVAPKSVHNDFVPAVRPYLQTLESFLGDIRLLAP